MLLNQMKSKFLWNHFLKQSKVQHGHLLIALYVIVQITQTKDYLKKSTSHDESRQP